MSFRKSKRNDIILIVALLLVAFIAYVVMRFGMGARMSASFSLVITVDSEEVFNEPVSSLSLPFEYRVETEDGGENVFRLSYVAETRGGGEQEVAGSQAGAGSLKAESRTDTPLTESGSDLMTGDQAVGLSCVYSNCPEQICVNTGTVTLADTPIVCLPHKVVARLTEN